MCEDCDEKWNRLRSYRKENRKWCIIDKGFISCFRAFESARETCSNRMNGVKKYICMFCRKSDGKLCSQPKYTSITKITEFSSHTNCLIKHISEKMQDIEISDYSCDLLILPDVFKFPLSKSDYIIKNFKIGTYSLFDMKIIFVSGQFKNYIDEIRVYSLENKKEGVKE